jgi:NRPS condensation-like uncharacterized protein
MPKEMKCPNHIINIVLRLKGKPNVTELKEGFRTHCLPFMKFHSVPSVPNLKTLEAVWTPVTVDLDQHFFESNVKSEVEADDVTQAIINTDLRDRSRPWWEAHVLYGDQGRISVIIFRLEHCLGDGVSLMEVMMPLAKDEKGEPLNLEALFAPSARGGRPKMSLLKTLMLPLSFVGAAVKILAGPLLFKDTSTPLRHMDEYKVWNRKRVFVRFPAVSLDFIKDIKNKAGKGFTVNDVMYAVYAGLVRKYNDQLKGPSADTVRIRVLTPFAFPVRTPVEHKYTATMRVFWIMLSTALPVAKSTALERLKASHGIFAAMKNSVIPLVSLKIQQFAASILPLAAVQDTAFKLMSSHSTVFSNVPGPQMPITFGGAKVDELHMVFPNVVPQVGIISVCGKVCAVLTVAEPNNPKDVEWLPKFYVEELKALAEAVGADPSKMFDV